MQGDQFDEWNFEMPFEYLKYASLVLNAILFGIWLRKKLNIHLFLQGHWRGTLSREDDSEIIYKVDLHLSDHKNQIDSGVMIYQVRNLETTNRLFSGVDDLRQYDGDWLFFWNRLWKPEFVRRFHVVYPPIGSTAVTHFMAHQYRYECRVRSYWFRPSLELTGTVGDHRVTGRLNKIASN